MNTVELIVDETNVFGEFFICVHYLLVIATQCKLVVTLESLVDLVDLPVFDQLEKLLDLVSSGLRNPVHSHR